LAHTIFKNSKKAVYRALFLTRDYNTKSQKSKKLPGKPKIYKVPPGVIIMVIIMVIIVPGSTSA
jgi:hypothetical protein